MAVYFFIFIFSIAFSYMYSKARTVDARVVFVVLLFMTLFIPAALRKGIGSDYRGYVAIFNQIKAGRAHDYEYLYVLLNRAVIEAGLPAQFIFAAMAFLNYLFLFLAIPRKHFFLAVPVYVLTCYLGSYSLIRQSLVLSIVLYALKFLSDKKYVKTAALIACAYGFHQSAVFYLPVFIISRMIKINKKLVIPLFIIIFIVCNYIITVDFILEKLVSGTFYAGYLTSSHYLREAEYNTGLGIILRRGMLFVIAAYLSCRVKRDNSHSVNLLFLFIFAMLAADIYSVKIHIFNRVRDMFSFSYVLYIPAMYDNKSRYRSLCIIFLLVILVALFGKNIADNPAKAGGGLGINPYTSIF